MLCIRTYVCVARKRSRRRGGASWRWTSRTRRAGSGWRPSGWRTRRPTGRRTARCWSRRRAWASTSPAPSSSRRRCTSPRAVDGRRMVDVRPCGAGRRAGDRIKVHKGLVPLAGSNDESWCQGLDRLASRDRGRLLPAAGRAPGSPASPTGPPSSPLPSLEPWAWRRDEIRGKTNTFRAVYLICKQR